MSLFDSGFGVSLFATAPAVNGGGIVAPNGYIYLTDFDGAYLIDFDGARLMEKI
jgi:hypothetical protein